MYCPRLDHFARFNPDGTISRCGHMVSPPRYQSLQELDESQWLKHIRLKFKQGLWPNECVRCEEIESIGQESIRQYSIKRHGQQRIPDYLQIGGVLDNICNSACQFCDPLLSTKIGSLIDKKAYPIVDNSKSFWNLPQDRIILLDISGGEPSASKNYKHLLDNLPPNLEKLRINTNGSLIIPGLDRIIDAGVDVTVTMSFDGLEFVHDYVRWPITWKNFEKNLDYYQTLVGLKLDLWTTVNALNINSLDSLIAYAQHRSINHAYAMLAEPRELNVGYKNPLTQVAKIKYTNSDNQSLANLANIIATKSDNTNELMQYIQYNDKLRGIRIEDYLGDIFK